MAVWYHFTQLLVLVVGRVAADQENGLSSRVEDEQDPAVLGRTSRSQLFEVVVFRSFDTVSVWSVELWSALGEKFDNSDDGVLFGFGQ